MTTIHDLEARGLVRPNKAPDWSPRAIRTGQEPLASAASTGARFIRGNVVKPVGGFADRALRATPAPVAGGLAALAGFYGGRALGGFFSDRLPPAFQNSGVARIGGGILGALALGIPAYLASNYRRTAGHQKQQSFYSPGADPARAALLQAINTDRALPGAVKQQATAAVASMSAAQIQALLGFLQTAAGAGIGALVVRWLTGKGFILPALGAVAGALIARPRPTVAPRGIYG